MTLTVTELSVARAGRRVIDRLGFQLADGEARAVRGPNGVGKSTLLRALAGLLPFEGTVRVDGIDVAGDSDAAAERIAYVGHLDAIKPQLTVAENLRFWAGLLGAPGIAKALDPLALAPLADRPVHTCSAGQKRRLCLARLTLAPRRLWLLDEPTVSLDTEAAARLTALIRAHCASGGMALVATHAPLDLGAAPPLDLATAPAPHQDAAADPFLAGAWT